jgi:predicted kinase
MVTVNVRGTSGSGKSTLVRAFMGDARVAHTNAEGKIEGYVSGGVYVVGKYETPCGGCDAVPTQDEVGRRVRQARERGYHVLFEGLLISGLFGERYRDLATACAPFLFAYLDTPLEVCLERVQARRAARGDTRPFNPHNTILKYHDVLRTRRKIEDAGFQTVTLSGDVAELRALFD